MGYKTNNKNKHTAKKYRSIIFKTDNIRKMIAVIKFIYLITSYDQIKNESYLLPKQKWVLGKEMCVWN